MMLNWMRMLRARDHVAGLNQKGILQNSGGGPVGTPVYSYYIPTEGCALSDFKNILQGIRFHNPETPLFQSR